MAYDKIVDSTALDTALTNIADSIRAKTGKTDPLTIEQMPSEIEGISGSGTSETDRTYSLYPPRDESVDWTADTFEGIYFTCDSKALPVGHPKRMFRAKITLQHAGNVDYQVDLGVIENGTFVIKENIVDWRSGDYMKVVIPDYNTDFVVLRIKPLNGIQCDRINADPRDVQTAFWVDRYGRMPYLTGWHTPGYSDYGGWTGLIRDSVITGERLDLNAAMLNMFSLREYTYPKFSTNLPSYANRGYHSFQNCVNLLSLDFSKHPMPVGITNLEYMFNNCYSLTSLDLSNFDTSAVTTMYGMFWGCFSLTSLDISNFNTSAVTNMSLMFFNCVSLTSLDLSNFNTSAVTNMDRMFSNCYSLTSLDLSNFDTSAVTNMGGMFNGCNSLTSLNINNFDTSTVTVMGSMFSGCTSLTSLDLSNFDTSAVTNMNGMFSNCTNLTNFTSCVFRKSIDFSTCTKLSHDSLMSIINNLAEVTNTQKLTLGKTNKTKLTINEIAIATEKGWTVV